MNSSDGGGQDVSRFFCRAASAAPQRGTSCGWGSVDELCTPMIGLWAPRDGEWQTVLARLSDSAAAEWRADVAKVQKLAALVAETDSFRPVPGSVLARDDMQVTPYLVSQAVLHNLNAGVIQLQAAQQLMQQGSQRVVASATLLRSSLEALAVALWILNSEEQSERLSLALAWFKHNVADERVAFADFVGNEKSDDNRIADIRRIATQNGLNLPGVNARVQSTDALRYADSALEVPNHLLLYVWRLCSGVAHGRPWAFANLTSTAPGAPVPKMGKLILDEANLMVPFRIAVVLLDAVFEAFERRTTVEPVFPSGTPARTES